MCISHVPNDDIPVQNIEPRQKPLGRIVRTILRKKWWVRGLPKNSSVRRPNNQRSDNGEKHSNSHLRSAPAKNETLRKRQPKRAPRHHTTRWISQNVQNLLDDKLNSLPSLMKADSYDVALLQETKRLTDTVDVEGYRFFFHGEAGGKQCNREARAGVGIGLSRLGQDAWKRAGSHDPIRISCGEGDKKAGRIIGLRLTFIDRKGKEVKYCVISAHLPHSGYSDDEYDECFEAIGHIVDGLDPQTIPYLGSDINARMGTSNDHESETPALGPYGLANFNARGERALHHISNMGFCSLPSFFQHDHYTSWYTINGCEPVLIDTCCTRKEDRKRFTDVYVGKNTFVESDHNPITAELKILGRTKRSGQAKKKRRRTH